MRDSTTEIHDIHFVRPGAAIVSATKHVFDDRGGNEGLPAKGSLTCVVVEEAGAWRIALAQTTPLAG